MTFEITSEDKKKDLCCGKAKVLCEDMALDQQMGVTLMAPGIFLSEMSMR